jgi:RNA polymerase-binding transcription factor DksA
MLSGRATFPDRCGYSWWVTFEERLTTARGRAERRLAALTRDFEAIVAASDAANADDEHDPEGATVGFERAQVAALIAQGRAHVAALDDALDRLHRGGYGTCARCGEPIAIERLEAQPAAVACIRCAAADRTRVRRP